MQSLIIPATLYILVRLYGWMWNVQREARVREARLRLRQQKREKFWRQWIELDAE